MSLTGEDEPPQGQQSSQTIPGRKKKIRGGHKAHLTKMCAEVDRLLEGYTADREARLLTLKGSLERKIAVVSKLDEEILHEVEDDDIVDEIEEAENVQTQIREKIVEMERVL